MIDRLLTIPERWPGRTIALVGVLFALAYGASLIVLAKPNGRIVIGDAVHYYVYLRSAVFDGDLRFRDEYVRIYGLRGGEPDTEWVNEPTATGHTRNLMSIGPAIAWAPLYLVAAVVSWLLHAIGGGPPPDGYGRLFQATAGLSGVLAATIGAALAYRAAAQLYDVRTAIWATLTMWLGSSAIYYSLISPTYSHAISMLTVGAFLFVWLKTRDRQTIGRYAIVGLLGGLAALVRWQDAVLLIVPAIDALWHALGAAPRNAAFREATAFREAATPRDGAAFREETDRGAARAQSTTRATTRGTHNDRPHLPPGRDAAGAQSATRATRAAHDTRHVVPRLAPARAVACLAACGASAVVAFLPQMLVWQTLYGSPFLVPQGEEFMRWTSPSLLSVLFSDWHGLLTWTPVVALALAGLVMLGRDEPMVATALGAAFLVSWYTNAAVADWWAGEAYGSRRFVSCFPLFVIGLGRVMRPFAAPSVSTSSRFRLLATAAIVIVGLNGLLLLQYQTFMHGLRTVAPYPRGAYELWLARFVVPFELVRRWLQS